MAAGTAKTALFDAQASVAHALVSPCTVTSEALRCRVGNELTGSDAFKLMEKVGAAWAGGDLQGLRVLLYPAGSWAFVDDGPRVINDPDELVDAIRELRRDPIYQVSKITHTPLTDRIVLGSCQVRTAMRNSRGHMVARYFLLLEVRDGLFYRSESFPSEDAARAAFERGWATASSTATSNAP